MMLFPFVDYWWLYAVFTALVLVLLALDLGLFHRTAHAPNFRDASVWMAVWIALALLFCFGLYQYAGWKYGDLAAKRTALEFLTGYVVEESLSLDNMFVFVLVFSYFRIPAEFHYRVLFFGILGLDLPGDVRRLGFNLTSIWLGCHSLRRLPYGHRPENDAGKRTADRAGEQPGDSSAP